MSTSWGGRNDDRPPVWLALAIAIFVTMVVLMVTAKDADTPSVSCDPMVTNCEGAP